MPATMQRQLRPKCKTDYSTTAWR